MSSSKSKSSGSRFLSRLNACTESAAVEVERSYKKALCNLVERQLDSRLRRRADGEDIVQNVWQSVFVGLKNKKYQIQYRGAVWGLLLVKTQQKIKKFVDHEKMKKRNPDAEAYPDVGQLLATDQQSPAAILLGEAIEAALKGMDPLESAVLQLQLFDCKMSDVLEIVLAGLDASDSQILSLRLQGWNMTEIGKAVGCTRKMVSLKLERICDRLQKLLAEKASG
jgi:RNA polymerase sigma factor (sigma-70 family)